MPKGFIPDVEDASTITQFKEATPTMEDFHLVVASGPDRGAHLTISFEHPSRILIGRSQACSLQLTDRQVSRRHAAVEWVGHALRLTDLGSSDGTFVDRVKVRAADLQGGEIIRVGSTSIRLDASDAQVGSVPEGTRFGNVIGSSLEMRRLYPLCARLAASDIPVVVEGETGTGKEVLAEALHDMGSRAKGPFIVFDCTAAAPSLLESELFGHERGAFTGAVDQRRGVFEQAHRGTLFIDEIGDLDLPLQAKLLRAIERRQVRRVGGNRWLGVDVRVISATRRNLDHEVEAGRFRDDLYHRLAVTRIELPPLRHRTGDVATLAQTFWRELGGVGTCPPDVLERWEDDAWPGNVRELRNAVARQIALGNLGELASGGTSAAASPRSMPLFDEIIASGLPFPQARDRILAEFETRYVEHVLAQHDGNVTRAAASSGIGRRYFQRIRARQAASSDRTR